MALKITVTGSAAESYAADALAVGVFAGKLNAVKALLKQVPGAAELVRRMDFTGKAGQSVELATGGGIKARHLVLIGVGDEEAFDAPKARTFAAQAARITQGLKGKALGLMSPAEGYARALAEGVVFGTYRFERYKTGDRRSSTALAKLGILGSKPNATIRSEADLGRRIAEATCIARDLINTPPNDLYPEALAAFAKDLAKRYAPQGLKCKVFNHKQIIAKGMNLLEAVGRGSSRGPVLIHFEYKPPKAGRKPLKKIVFVGKGITFDTGGICLKPAAGMDDMKGDMGGSANVVALMAAVAEAQPNAHVHGIVASAENMPDGHSYRPGDIFTSYEGKTVEIINTDAEGRLALADGLAYAQELEPDLIVCNATLTGAAMVALGKRTSAVYATEQSLADDMLAAAQEAGEDMWHMPMQEHMRKKLDSPWADLRHVGDRWGGSIIAAVFLREFVGDYPFVHLDVAGPSMADESYGFYTKGGTGHGVLSFLSLIERLA